MTAGKAYKMIVVLVCNMRRKTHSKIAQGTVEYAVVFFGFLSLVLALGVMAHFLQEGSLISHALQGASYHLGGLGGAIQDVFLF